MTVRYPQTILPSPSGVSRACRVREAFALGAVRVLMNPLVYGAVAVWMMWGLFATIVYRFYDDIFFDLGVDLHPWSLVALGLAEFYVQHAGMALLIMLGLVFVFSAFKSKRLEPSRLNATTVVPILVSALLIFTALLIFVCILPMFWTPAKVR